MSWDFFQIVFFKIWEATSGDIFSSFYLESHALNHMLGHKAVQNTEHFGLHFLQQHWFSIVSVSSRHDAI